MPSSAPVQPCVSVVIPTYNRLSLLMKAVECLKAQDYPVECFEVIIVDDGSTDGTGEWIRSVSGRVRGIEIRPLIQHHGGPAAARNLGIEEARGDLIAFTDDDCLPQPNWLSCLVLGLQDQACAATAGRIACAEGVGIVSRFCEYMQFNTQSGHGETYIDKLNTANALCPTELLRSIGGFDTKFRWPGGEDTDLGNRIRALGHKIRACPSAVVVHTGRDSLSGMCQAYYDRGKGGAYLLSNRPRIKLAVRLCVSLGRILWNSICMICVSPINGLYDLLSGRLPFRDALPFGVLRYLKKLAKYSGHAAGIVGIVGQGIRS